ncbi:hypothetical protein RBU60_08625 [Mesonia sp. MT50]|uniref:Uncharacterized protein n=1 Tax=Mesonia profundi TaxID=3070998 RepID=A0ABU1A1T2_9FLAO|nr:hypothetical protein [Mesonia profundi]MDQ7917637.1 hypothetical protein [Mesonia profundi]
MSDKKKHADFQDEYRRDSNLGKTTSDKEDELKIKGDGKLKAEKDEEMKKKAEKKKIDNTLDDLLSDEK